MKNEEPKKLVWLAFYEFKKKDKKDKLFKFRPNSLTMGSNQNFLTHFTIIRNSEFYV